MNVKVFLLTCLMGTAMIGLQAQTHTPRVTKQQVNQQKRIGQGVKSGELTRKETRELQRQQKRINRSKKVAKADGVVTKKERKVLNARQRNASANIARKKNNRRSRN